MLSRNTNTGETDKIKKNEGYGIDETSDRDLARKQVKRMGVGRFDNRPTRPRMNRFDHDPRSIRPQPIPAKKLKIMFTLFDSSLQSIRPPSTEVTVRYNDTLVGRLMQTKPNDIFFYAN